MLEVNHKIEEYEQCLTEIMTWYNVQTDEISNHGNSNEEVETMLIELEKYKTANRDAKLHEQEEILKLYDEINAKLESINESEYVSTNVYSTFSMKIAWQKLEGIIATKEKIYAVELEERQAASKIQVTLDSTLDEDNTSEATSELVDLTEEDTRICEEFSIPVMMMGLAIGTKGENIEKARALEGISKISTDRQQCKFKIYGENIEIVKTARSMLEFTEESVLVPSVFIGRIIGKQGKSLEEIKQRSGVLRINSARGRKTENNTETEQPVPFKIVGTKVAVEEAVSLLQHRLNILKDPLFQQWETKKREYHNDVSYLKMWIFGEIQKSSDGVDEKSLDNVYSRLTEIKHCKSIEKLQRWQQFQHTSALLNELNSILIAYCEPTFNPEDDNSILWIQSAWEELDQLLDVEEEKLVKELQSLIEKEKKEFQDTVHEYEIRHTTLSLWINLQIKEFQIHNNANCLEEVEKELLLYQSKEKHSKYEEKEALENLVKKMNSKKRLLGKYQIQTSTLGLPTVQDIESDLKNLQCAKDKKIHHIKREIFRLKHIMEAAKPKQVQTNIVEWKWLDNTGKWTKFGTEGSLVSVDIAAIEKAYKTYIYKKNSKESLVTFKSGALNHHYLINFSKMNQTNIATKKVRNIQRINENGTSGFMETIRGWFQTPNQRESLKPPLIVWKWQDDNGVYQPYDHVDNYSAIDNDILEHQYSISRNNVPFEFTSVTLGYNYKIDFNKKVIMNLTVNKERPIKRELKIINTNGSLGEFYLDINDTRSNWSPMNDNEPWKVVELQQSTAEFEEISSYFTRSLSQHCVEIVTIHRYQNIRLWTNFQSCRREMLKLHGYNEDLLDQQRLFHGTKSSVVDSICKSNLDRGLCGTNVGTVYGKGVYFSNSADCSFSYCDSGNVRKVMFVALVLVGSVTCGNSTMLQLPDISGKRGIKYDTAVDNISQPQIFVKFQDDGFYPEYYITFQERGNYRMSWS